MPLSEWKKFQAVKMPLAKWNKLIAKLTAKAETDDAQAQWELGSCSMAVFSTSGANPLLSSPTNGRPFFGFAEVRRAVTRPVSYRWATAEGLTLLDALNRGQDVQQTVSDLGNRLQQLTQQREHAEKALAKFDKEHEPDAVIQARIEERQSAAAAEERRAIALPRQKKLQRALDCLFEAKAIFEEELRLQNTDSSAIFRDNFEVVTLCKTGMRNFLTPIGNHKIWCEGGGGEVAMRRIINNAV